MIKNGLFKSVSLVDCDVLCIKATVKWFCIAHIPSLPTVSDQLSSVTLKASS